ncbi:interleukin-1 receptor-associated kinase 3 isoform X2 [Betta splendens]|uniref:Interleukin-1 receptor-associated kinase 3 isoform X2 n=1 Tax=Betta splendens TaxID=158456 RepID=A0A6P7NFK2_BETSP|nr:interleukin-1 receptor-associated kinase 3 isoform X2 [Betta splendens]
MECSTFLYDVPPAVVESFCKIMDSGGDSFGWRALAVRIVPTLLEVQMLERVGAAGRSPTREMLWSWAQQNKTVLDLLTVLQDMGHHRALQLFHSQLQSHLQAMNDTMLPPSSRHTASTRQQTDIKIKESLPVKTGSSSQALSPSCFVSEKPREEKPRPTLTFQDVVEGTRDFHHDLRISEGQFSDVYRGQMGGKTFAVKLFKQNSAVSWKKLWDIFRKEMEIHHLHQHPNILELLGCFSDERRYCLVYPFLPSGSLFHRLHHRVQEPPLSWQERLNIIKGIAKALHHLHTSQPCPVICGNISSANILLDEDQPKLTDFGLARLRPHSTNQSCTISLNAGCRGNLGYLPEEYIRDGKLSFSLDVYSFGMVIMETVTGRKVIDDSPKQTQLRDLLSTEVENSGGMDSCLRFLDGAAGEWPTALALRLLTLALECAASRHRSRPSMENPHSLHDSAPPGDQRAHLLSAPVEDDEQRGLAAGPCECSQSEVTYLSDVAGANSAADVDLYGSCPVQCSCSEAAGRPCEDCRANGFTLSHTDCRQNLTVVENEAKQRVRNKLSLYNKGLMDTEELLSETGQ